ncbi:hypothetical protein NIES2135_27180 [Leptolyngbya boryana NIES-2135]|jgi:hypothetical protein|uniref:Uncharacterized protein n=1 Tax=Leptolyngbya boryana NIES-2135 TaxID=1973484 RepID=A0A1Z4JGU8_LEPBY|nr:MULTISPECIES: hypothetical protein [Leptolyngbya]BAY55893.1 hypothetical protein NIES2135_27180 [Leptolyngbya boryana NIES-2135]MBD2368804.1 hypothetical protein [Leptolyngbya sp. FACHB-161]MBD2375328.1 hypothetical protein [Leptolyngbya sp. FACHB-238]MBD2399746.1 hypothetical protein [Leptolyngbya sp. FACHB-239]MBD2405952.1 hypothetical protein [Leptolyngbya sp. FACHB-402]
MLYEITGTHNDWMMVHAASPEEAISEFEEHSPESMFLSIQEVRSTFEAVSISGERVKVIDRKYLTCWNRKQTKKRIVLHYKTSSELGCWVPADEFVRAEVVAA